MAGKVLPSIELCSDPEFANGSEQSDDTYIEEEGTPAPDDPEAWLIWGRKKYGEEWYRNAADDREAALSARREEEERERIENKELEDIRSLRETDFMEYERRMRIYKLLRKGLSLEQIEKLKQPQPREEADRIQKGFAKLLGGKTLPSTTTEKHVNTRLRPRKSMKSHAIRKGKIVKAARKKPNRPRRTRRSSNR